MKKFTFLLLLFSYFLSYAQIPGKRPTEYGFDIDYRPPVYYDFYLSYANENRQSELIFTLNIQNDLFQFTKVEDTYEAVYHITLTIKKSGTESAVFSRVWKESVWEKEFEKTNSRKIYQNHQKRFTIDLAPGSYQVFLEVSDAGTQKGFRNSRPLVIPEFEPGGVKHTSVKLLNPETGRSDEVIAGSRDPMVDFNRDIKAYFELQTGARDSLIITSKLVHLKEDASRILRQRIYRYLPTEPVLSFREEIEKKYLPEGIFVLRYRIRYGERILEIEKKFEVVWFEKPVYLYRYDLALRPMQYILSVDELSEAEGLSYDDLGVWFTNYWRAKDPDPDTPFNEILFTFFQRVDEVNRKYGQRFREGWETDRGKSFLLYGEPDRQEINRTSVHVKPYEVWYYNTLKQKLTFIDEYDDDDYKLVQIEDIKDSGNE